MESMERPDGSVATPIGWILIVIGIIGAFVGALAETLNGTLIGFAIANLGFGLGVLLLALGYLVRAIWFLPGREIPLAEIRASSPSIANGPYCSWCSRRLPAGARTCDSYDAEGLTQVSEKVTDPVCKPQLQERGYPVAPKPRS
jgi:hypothetical protein